ncbi:hypothetical protein [Thiomicrorhabdus lithotrophica]|uniref:Oxygen tolerance protein BatD n=1 Tax=Thiomicrorhabdus lithotrophica TaxID=2949997 RepID=A0ABY8CDM8_9GAMM|nr:hypothetical protein [Thiomicrorhabdus lithotrophica]WEJ62775.1 hypothetical protein NR989_00590 [Thiomicrorhabdus lithotrophica]
MVKFGLAILFSSWFLVLNVAQAIEIQPSSVNYSKLVQKNLSIKVKIRPEKVQLGEPVTLVIEGEQLAKSVVKIDWSVFTQDFVIDDINQGSNLLRVRLYPLKTGQFTIKAQAAGAIKIPETIVSVEENPGVQVDWSSPQAVLYSQQQAIWQADVKVSNPAFLIELQSREEQENQGVVVHLFKENLMASYEMPTVFEAQVLTLSSPVIEVKNTTNRRWKFFDYPQEVQLQPLPSFLPVSVAVGQLEWEIKPLKHFYQNGELDYWQWQLNGHGLTGDYLKAVAYQLVSQLQHSEEVSWLSESMSLEQTFDEHGMLSKLQVQVPYRINQPGLVTFPELVLRVFNPQTGKVKQQTFNQSMALVMPAWIVWVVQWIALLLVLFGLFLVLFLIKQAWYNQKLVKAIRHALSPQDIWFAMQTWQNHQAWHQTPSAVDKSTSIGLWQQWYLDAYAANEKQIQTTQRLVNLLNKALFSESTNNKDGYDRSGLQRVEAELFTVAVEWSARQSVWPSFAQIKRYLLQIKQQLSNTVSR